MTAANRVAEIFDAPREITDGPRTSVPRGGRLELVDVGFRFPDVDPTNGPCATSTSPSSPARRSPWSGRPGSGKSVLVSLLSRLYDVTEGAILIDGSDIRDLSPARAAAGGGHRLRGPDAVLDVGGREPAARQSRRDRRAAGAGRRGRRRRLRLRPAVRSGHPDRRAGHEPVRRSAATAFAGAGAARRARRSWCSTTRCRRSTCTPRPWSPRRCAACCDRRSPAWSSRNRASTVLLADRVALLEGGTITRVGTHAELLADVPRVPLPAGRRRRARRRRRAQLRLGATRTAAARSRTASGKWPTSACGNATSWRRR